MHFSYYSALENIILPYLPLYVFYIPTFWTYNQTKVIPHLELDLHTRPAYQSCAITKYMSRNRWQAVTFWVKLWHHFIPCSSLCKPNLSNLLARARLCCYFYLLHLTTVLVPIIKCYRRSWEGDVSVSTIVCWRLEALARTYSNKTSYWGLTQRGGTDSSMLWPSWWAANCCLNVNTPLNLLVIDMIKL